MRVDEASEQSPRLSQRRIALASVAAYAATALLFGLLYVWVFPDVRTEAIGVVALLSAALFTVAVALKVFAEPRLEEDGLPRGLWRTPETGKHRPLASESSGIHSSDATWRTASGHIVLKRMRDSNEAGLKQSTMAQEAELAHALRLKKSELRQRLRERALLFDILRISATENELKTVVTALASRLGTDLKLREFAILLRENREGLPAHFVVRATHGFKDPEALVGRSLREGEGVSGEVARIRHPILVPDVNAEPHYQAFWDQAPRAGSFAAFPILHGRKLIGLMALTRPPEATLSEVEVRFLSAVADQMALAISHAQLVERLREASTMDELTGLANRRLFQTRLQNERERVTRFGQPLSLMLIDIDHFKQLNDQSGHAVGDAALREVAKVVRSSVRRIDTVARHGGEEFVVLLPHATVHQAARVAEKIRQAVTEASIPGADKQPGGIVSVSVGVAQLAGQQSSEALVERADRAMYAAKAGGRNRVAYFASVDADAPEYFGDGVGPISPRVSDVHALATAEDDRATVDSAEFAVGGREQELAPVKQA